MILCCGATLLPLLITAYYRQLPAKNGVYSLGDKHDPDMPLATSTVSETCY